MGAPQRAVLWTKGGEVVDLGTFPGGNYSTAYAINERGEVVGVSSDAAGYSHAVLWTERRAIVDLGTLPGDVSSSANGVNAAGIVVGASLELNAVQSRSFVGILREGLRELGGLPGATNTRVEDINNAGTAVGSSGSYSVPRAVKWVRSQSAAADRAP